MSEPAPQLEGWLVVVDLQHVFGDEDSPWIAPRFAEVRPRIRRLVTAFGDRVVWTRFVAPAEPVGAWKEYYEQFEFALRPPDAPLYQLIEDPGPHPVVDATTFGKWGPDLAAVVGNGPITVAGSCDDDHDRALRIMGLYAPLVEITTTDEVLAGR